ncbi:MAG: class I SAM-dependent methyltransferase [Rubrivivax sp.]
MKTTLALRWPPPLRWPLPALLAWGLAWLGFAAARAGGWPAAPSALLAAALGAAPALGVQGGWRKLLVAGGFPLSAVALGAAVPAWAWPLAVLPLLLAYPLRAWADAPLFPTPSRALSPLAGAIALPPGARVLDAGCGLGHGLRALHAAWPAARIEGVEWSALLAWACARRCRFAAVRRGDLWADDWRGLDVVYLFQRPESMARAWAKAQAELDKGAWLVSLEFAVPGVQPWRRLDAGGGRPLWVYRPGARAKTQRNGAAADNHANRCRPEAFRGGPD